MYQGPGDLLSEEVWVKIWEGMVYVSNSCFPKTLNVPRAQLSTSQRTSETNSGLWDGMGACRKKVTWTTGTRDMLSTPGPCSLHPSVLGLSPQPHSQPPESTEHQDTLVAPFLGAPIFTSLLSVSSTQHNKTGECAALKGSSQLSNFKTKNE